MLNISKTARYGLRALLYLAKNRDRGLVKIDQIAREEEIPENYLRKIFQRFIKNGIVYSGVGPTGGVKLSTEADHISIARAIEVIDGRPSLAACTLFGYAACPKLDQCPIHLDCDIYKQKLWQKLEQFNIGQL